MQSSLRAIPEYKRSRGDGEFVALLPEAARIELASGIAIAQHGQFGAQLLRAQFKPRIKLERPRVDPRRQCPALALELGAYRQIEIERKTR